MKAFLTSVLLSASVLLAQECPEMPPMECADGDILCPMGADEFGCAFPDVCMPSGSVCPVVCPVNTPPMCDDGAVGVMSYRLMSTEADLEAPPEVGRQALLKKS